jgi:molybdate transport system ATP-binding protein
MIRLSVRKNMEGPEGPAVLDANLLIEERSFVAVTGPSGAGKTTLLRLIAGLDTPDEGTIAFGEDLWFDSATKLNMPARKRDAGFVFQEHALFPNMTLRGNIHYACGDNGFTDSLILAAKLDRVADRYPSQLSAGQRQRCALLRAIARRPRILLLDEPFSSLDRQLKQSLHEELSSWRGKFGFTVIMVSHDRAEVVRLSDRVIEIRNGSVESDVRCRYGCGMKKEREKTHRYSGERAGSFAECITHDLL